MKITYSAAVSADGFIARENGDVSWLDEMQVGADESGLEEFFRSVDALVMGRKTYDFVFNYGSWPYEDKLTWVCTHSDLERLEGARLITVSDIEDVVGQAKARGIEHIWLVGGGRLASAFLAKGWITHLSLAEMPIKLGGGIPLFSDHQLDDIAFVERKVVDKARFRQLEITVKLDSDETRGPENTLRVN